MTGTVRRLPRGRRVAALSAAVLSAAVLFAVGACAKPADQGGQAGTQGVGGFGGPGQASGGPPTSTPAPPAPPPVTYPKTARAYAEAVLAAWGQKQQDRLTALTNAQVYEQIVEIPGPPNMTWTYVQCDGAAGSSYCAFYNGDGDDIVLRLTNERLGKAHAASEVRFNLFPDDGVEYVRQFVQAWTLAHKPRMLKLAVPDVVNAVVEIAAAPKNPKYATPEGGGGLLVVRITNDEGFSLDLHVGTTLLGHPHAIVGRG
jgi:hypothetical protein